MCYLKIRHRTALRKLSRCGSHLLQGLARWCVNSLAAEVRQADETVTIVSLVGSQTKLVEAPIKQKFKIKHKGSTKPKECAMGLQWSLDSSSQPKIAHSKDKEFLLLREGKNAIGISNIAPVPHPDGLSHFEHHYVGVKLKEGDSQLELEPDDKVQLGTLFIDVFDCVPMVSWP